MQAQVTWVRKMMENPQGVPVERASQNPTQGINESPTSVEPRATRTTIAA